MFGPTDYAKIFSIHCYYMLLDNEFKVVQDTLNTICREEGEDQHLDLQKG